MKLCKNLRKKEGNLRHLHTVMHSKTIIGYYMMTDGYLSLIFVTIYKISREKGMIVIHENDKKDIKYYVIFSTI